MDAKAEGMKLLGSIHSIALSEVHRRWRKPCQRTSFPLHVTHVVRSANEQNLTLLREQTIRLATGLVGFFLSGFQMSNVKIIEVIAKTTVSIAVYSH